MVQGCDNMPVTEGLYSFQKGVAHHIRGLVESVYCPFFGAASASVAIPMGHLTSDNSSSITSRVGAILSAAA